MKRQLIELNKLDDLLREYKQMGQEGEGFADFIRVSKCLFEDEPSLFDWVYVDNKNIIEVREDE